MSSGIMGLSSDIPYYCASMSQAMSNSSSSGRNNKRTYKSFS